MKTLKVFREYRDRIVDCVQRDMRERLRESLEETCGSAGNRSVQRKRA